MIIGAICRNSSAPRGCGVCRSASVSGGRRGSGGGRLAAWVAAVPPKGVSPPLLVRFERSKFAVQLKRLRRALVAGSKEFLGARRK